jgi:hypothetical protein
LTITYSLVSSLERQDAELIRGSFERILKCKLLSQLCGFFKRCREQTRYSGVVPRAEPPIAIHIEYQSLEEPLYVAQAVAA